MDNSIKTSELNAIVESYLRNTNFSYTHISSMNEFYSQGLSLILTQFFEIKKSVVNKRSELLNGQEITTISLEIYFKNVELARPQTENGKPMYPADARLGGKTYSGQLSTDIHIKIIAFLKNGESVEREEVVKGFDIANLPILVGSNMCNTWQMTNTALQAIGEDPTDTFGYCIISGTEWFINNIFSRKYNIWHYYHNENEQDIDLARAEIISMPGDSFENSSEIKIQYLKSGEIVFTLTSDRYFKLIGIPFHIILRLLGIENERAMVMNIVPDTEFPGIDERMRSIIINAINHPSKNFPEARKIVDLVALQRYCIEVIANHYVNTTGTIDLNAKQIELQKEIDILKEVFMSNLDNNILPHQGKLQDYRFIKAHYLCIGINLVLRCYFGYNPSTSRDSHEIKRIHTTGDSFSRMFKKEVNSAIVRPVRMHFEKIAMQTPFENIDLKTLITAIEPSKLQSCIIKNLNTGISDEKGADGKSKKNRMPSENHKRRGIPGNINASTISRSPNSAGSYQNERAYEMRRVQPGQSVCVIQSAEGINVGMTTNTTLGLIVSKPTSTEVMKQFLIQTKMIIEWNKVKTRIGFGIVNMMKVMVNGQWIGYVDKYYDLIRLCKERRRGWDLNTLKRLEDKSLDRKLTISLSYALDFRTDRGRGLVPYIVVRNNSKFDLIGQQIIGSKEDSKTGKHFKQIILLTKKHITGLQNGSVTVENLFDEGIIDYIAPEELKMVHAADTMETFAKHANDPFMRYTHVFIPVTLISIITAFSPYLHHGPPTRTSLATNHLRNACSIFSLAHWTRFDKQAYMCINNEYPLVYTISNIIIPTNGTNIFVSINSYGGHNQEDSLDSNNSAAQRGAFAAEKFTFHKSILEKNEEFCKPDILVVANIRENASYDKISAAGFPVEGTYIEDGDVIVGKRSLITQLVDVRERGKQYEDKSEIYYGERALVVGVKQGVDASYKIFVMIRLEISRPNSEGQKFASREGQKGMAVNSIQQSDLFFTSSGLIPVLGLNPHAFPTRMTINQLIEALKAKIAILYGGCCDATMSVAVDIDEIGQKLVEKGFDRNGNTIMYSGYTGESFHMPIFFCPMYYQRLNKFAEEEGYAVSEGNRTALNRQPTSGRQHNGGLRLGEMEKDCFLSHGSVMFMREKFARDCDGMPLYICRKCNLRAIANERKELYICKNCKSDSNVVKLPTRFASHFLLNCFETLGIAIKYIMQPREFLK